MLRGFSFFWIIFIGYFIFVHPAIIYYSTGYESVDLSTVSPNTALSMLALSVTLWLIVGCLSLWVLLRYTYFAQRNIRILLRDGVRLRTKVVGVTLLKGASSKSVPKTIVLELVNLEGETIRHSMSFNDSKPEQQRYQVGSICYLRVDPSFTKRPSVLLEESLVKINWSLPLVWLLFVASAIYYFQFSYDLESAGYGWRFLSFWHPLIIIPACCLFFPGILYGLIKFVFMKKMNMGGKVEFLKFKGKRALASITRVEQTGTMINDQPEIRFHVEFLDGAGRNVSAQIKKIVSLIDVAQVRSQKEAFVFYDPNNTQTVAFEEDISKQ